MRLAVEPQSSLWMVWFFSAMKDGPAYGYELATRFRKMSGGHMKISYGTIYPLGRRMDGGPIRSKKHQPSSRVYYELTKRGTEAQKRVSGRMDEYQKEMEEKLLGILSMHATIFGRKALRDVLKRVE